MFLIPAFRCLTFQRYTVTYLFTNLKKAAVGCVYTSNSIDFLSFSFGFASFIDQFF